MESRVETILPKKLIGMHMKMSLAKNKTSELWQMFMSRRAEVGNRVTSSYFSMQVYGKGQEQLFSPTTLFEKWAAVEVLTHEVIPDDMEAYSLGGGKYAVFLHKGLPAPFPKQ